MILDDLTKMSNVQKMQHNKDIMMQIQIIVVIERKGNQSPICALLKAKMNSLYKNIKLSVRTKNLKEK